MVYEARPALSIKRSSTLELVRFRIRIHIAQARDALSVPPPTYFREQWSWSPLKNIEALNLPVVVDTQEEVTSWCKFDEDLIEEPHQQAERELMKKRIELQQLLFEGGASAESSERTAVLLAQGLYARQREEDAKRAKPSLAIPESEAPKAEEKGGAATASTKPDNRFQIPAGGRPSVQTGSLAKEPTGRRGDAKDLDMQWKLDTYFIPKGAWVYMSKSYKEEVTSWCELEEGRRGATF
ncbi:hypothetical protein F4818DRAFT_442834 [Hypoxylon cercidicola]|nr:hypothetical protein F4818DRAFT_442834 [Hypoxylon cercidicola]